MNVSQPISFAFWSIFWRFPTVVPHPPTLSESELALRAGTDQLLGRYVEATGSPKFRALVAHHRDQIGTGNPDNGLQLLAQSVLLAIEELGPHVHPSSMASSGGPAVRHRETSDR